MQPSFTSKEVIRRIRADRSNRGISPNLKAVRRFVREIRDCGLSEASMVRDLIGSGDVGCLKVAAILLPDAGMKDSQIFRLALGLADHENWEVREYAADVLSTLFARDPMQWKSRLLGLRAFPSARVRRAVVMACRGPLLTRPPKHLRSVVDVLVAFADDGDGYVAKAHGPFVVGDYFIRASASDAMQLIRKFAMDMNEQVRLNAARALTTAAGAELGSSTLPLLLSLSQDTSSRVRAAAGRALRRLRLRYPDLEALQGNLASS
jgi:hypothetical protein